MPVNITERLAFTALLFSNTTVLGEINTTLKRMEKTMSQLGDAADKAKADYEQEKKDAIAAEQRQVASDEAADAAKVNELDSEIEADDATLQGSNSASPIVANTTDINGDTVKSVDPNAAASATSAVAGQQGQSNITNAGEAASTIASGDSATS